MNTTDRKSASVSATALLLSVILAGCGPKDASDGYTRDYVSTCPGGTKVVWQSFAWEAVISNGTSIDFKAQTGTSTSALGAAVAIGSATTTTSAWTTGPLTVDQALRAASPTQQSQSVLRVRMTFNKNGTATPTLTHWNQPYECVRAD